VLNRHHGITADVDIPDGDAEGVLLGQGSAAGGYSPFVKDGTSPCVHNYVARDYFGVASDRPVAPGRHELRFEFEPTGELDFLQGATARRAGCSSTSIVRSSVRPTCRTPLSSPSNPGALTCGANPGSPITDDHQGPFRFTGTLRTVTVDVSGELITDQKPRLRCTSRATRGARAQQRNLELR